MKAAWCFALLGALAACKRDRPTPPAAPADAAAAPVGETVSAAPLRTSPWTLFYIIVPPPDADPARLAAGVGEAAKAAGLEVEVEIEPADVERLLRLFDKKARGLDDAARRAIGAAKTELSVRTEATETSFQAQELALVATVHAATRGGGVIVDPATLEVFSRDAFAELRVGQPKIELSRWIVMHLTSQPDGSMHVETFGLARFGLPEFLLRDVPYSAGRDASKLLTAAAQLLLERGALTGDGALAVPGPKGTVTWKVTWSDGDLGEDIPDVLELTPPGTGDPEKRIYDAIAIHGIELEDTARSVSHDDPELQAASARAKKELAALADHFEEGIPALENLTVKAPFGFGNEGKSEWMWVEVHSWKGDTLSGVLVNQPVMATHVELGDRVDVGLRTVYDYIHVRADGSQAGGETVEIMQRKYDQKYPR
jgi:uncharacterized protein YegJ (DUF2314 family)